MALYTERRSRIAVLPEWAGGTDFKIGAASSPGQPATTTPLRFPPHPAISRAAAEVLGVDFLQQT
jgi:hypothetical protein